VNSVANSVDMIALQRNETDEESGTVSAASGIKRFSARRAPVRHAPGRIIWNISPIAA
jgi:hypothetical protein